MHRLSSRDKASRFSERSDNRLRTGGGGAGVGWGGGLVFRNTSFHCILHLKLVIVASLLYISRLS